MNEYFQASVMEILMSPPPPTLNLGNGDINVSPPDRGGGGEETLFLISSSAASSSSV